MSIKHNFDFDPTCGFSKKELLQVTAPDCRPDDYVSFWENTYRETLKIPVRIFSKKELWSPEPDIKIWEICFASWEDVEICAWIVRPEKSKGGLVHGHGYGSRVWFDVTWAKEEGLTCIYPCIRGLSLSSHHEIPWETKKHVLHRIDSRDKYVLRGAAADIWQSASVLLSLFPDVMNNLNYTGSSFGGGLGALSLAWDKRFRTGYLGVPTFGNNLIRLKYKSTGSAEAQRIYMQEHPEVIDVIKYYDASLAAKYIEAKMICAPALFDPSVIPPGQFSIANSLDKSNEIFILPAGHFSDPENQETYDKIPLKQKDLFRH